MIQVPIQVKLKALKAQLQPKANVIRLDTFIVISLLPHLPAQSQCGPK